VDSARPRILASFSPRRPDESIHRARLVRVVTSVACSGLSWPFEAVARDGVSVADPVRRSVYRWCAIVRESHTRTVCTGQVRLFLLIAPDFPRACCRRGTSTLRLCIDCVWALALPERAVLLG